MSDKYRPVTSILEDPNLTIAQKFLMILEQTPTCIFGSDCEMFRYLCGELTLARAKEQDPLIPNTSIYRERLKGDKQISKQTHPIFLRLEEFDRH